MNIHRLFKMDSGKKEQFVILALAGILLLVVCIPVKKDTKETLVTKSEKKTESILSEQNFSGGSEQLISSKENSVEIYRASMEAELEQLLNGMEGAGKVKVMLTLKYSEEALLEKDRPVSRKNMTENDAEGGSRSTNEFSNEENTVYVTDSEGKKIPVIRKKMQPVVEGAVVSASGAGSEAVRQNITEVVQVLFGLEPNKIRVIKMKTAK